MEFTNICPVFLVENVEKTTEYYVNVLGFKYAKHFDKADKFETVYRDRIEIVIIEKQKGNVENNTVKYGNGYDAYIDTDTIESIDEIYKEYNEKNVTIVKEPFITDYGSYEFAFQDIDGRIIGIGLIKNNETYFNHSNYIEEKDEDNV